MAYDTFFAHWVCLSKSIVRSHHQKNVFEISSTLCMVFVQHIFMQYETNIIHIIYTESICTRKFQSSKYVYRKYPLKENLYIGQLLCCIYNSLPFPIPKNLDCHVTADYWTFKSDSPYLRYNIHFVNYVFLTFKAIRFPTYM